MTERLCDGAAPPDPDLARLAAITAAVRPHAPSDVQRQRVWRALATASERPRAARSRLAMALVAVLIAGPVVAAAATVATRWVARQVAAPRPAGVAPQAAAGDVRIERVAVAPPRAPASVPVVATPVAAAEPCISPPASRAERARPHGGVPKRVAPIVAAAKDADSAAGTAPDAILVVEAVKALRVSHDAGRAEELLARYQLRQPNGVLSEDAQALQIEAAAPDPPRAARLAAAYLARYPAGRFRASAERAMVGRASGETP